MEKRILLASPRGFCMGVDRAVRMLEEALDREPGPVYVRGEVVHNAALVRHFQERGAVMVDEVEQVPEGGVVVFSAHGVPPSVRQRAAERGLRVIDTTCPLVEKVHREARRFRDMGCTILLIGQPGHPEVIGVAGEAPEHVRVISREEDVETLDGIDGGRVAWLSQTTMNVDKTLKIAARLRERYPLIQSPPQGDICRATKDRQTAVGSIAPVCDLFIVVGSMASANTRELAAVAARSARAIRVDEPEELEGVDFTPVTTVGVSSGASVAEAQLARTVDFLRRLGYIKVEERECCPKHLGGEG